jgi:spore coat protein CotH
MLVMRGLIVLSLMASPAVAQTTDELFNNQVLQRVDLQLHSADWNKLKEEFLENEYYPAALIWNGQTVRNVGIRSRGHGSRSGRKPGLRVDFDRYASDQTFLGLKSVILDNLTQDSSGIHETSAMQLMARMGIPAPREAHARLYVNNEYAGLYVIVEAVDKRLLARVFGIIEEDTQNDGYLYEFNWIDEWRLGYLGDDLGPYKDRFDAKTHESKGDENLYRPIETLIRLINETREDRLAEVIGPLLDLPAFVRFVAAQNFLADSDGVLGTWGVNNFYLYRLENREQHVLIAWDTDVTFWGPTFPTNEGHDDNALMAKLMRVPEYRDLYYAELRRAMDLASEPVGDSTWLDTEIRRQFTLIETAMREDPLKPYPNGQFDNSRTMMETFTKNRLLFIRCEMERGARSGCESVVPESERTEGPSGRPVG